MENPAPAPATDIMDKVFVWDIGGEGAAFSPSDPLPPFPWEGNYPPAGTAVVIAGRAPIWRYGMAMHAVHGLAAVVATFDPRLGGGVVVASHHPDWKEGDLVPVDEEVN